MKKNNSRKIFLVMLNANGWRNPDIHGGGEVQTVNVITRTSNDIQWIVALPSQLEKFVENFRRNNIKYIFLDRIFKKTSVATDILQGIFFAAKVVYVGVKRKKDYDLIYSSTTNFSDILPAKIIAVLTRKKLVAKYHISLYDKSGLIAIYRNYRNESNGFIDSILRALLARTTLSFLKESTVISVCHFLSNQLLRCGIKKDRLKVNYNGVDFLKLNELKLSGAVNKKYDLCFMGRVEKSKGLDDFIELVKRLKSDNANIRAVIIGGGPYLPEVKRMIAENKLNDNMDVVGWLGLERFEYLQKSKIFISLTVANEGFGLVLMEALFFDIFSVAYTQPVFEEVFGNYEKVCLVDKNIDMVEREVKRILEGDHNKSVSKKNDISMYSIEACAKREEEILKEIKL